jgi:hypothetical protein
MNFGNFNARSRDKLNLPGAIDSVGHEIAGFFFSQNRVAESTSLLGCFNYLSTGKVQAVCLNLKVKALQAARRP